MTLKLTLKRIFISAVMLVFCMNAVPAPARGEGAVRTLDEAYQAALNNNERIRIAEEDVNQSSDRIDQAWTYLYPRIDGRAAYTRYNETLPPGGGPFIFQPTDQFQAALVLTQPLYTGGRTLAALRTARTLRDRSDASLSLARQDMMLSVAEAYYGVLRARKIIEISRNSLARMERHKEVVEREAATRRTKANRSALLRAESLVAQARIALTRAEDGLRIAREKLVLLTGATLDSELVEPPQPERPSGALEDLQKTALVYRDDYANAGLSRSIAEENVTIVRGGHYPQVSAEAGVTYVDSSPATQLDATVYYGGLRLQVPIFEGGLMKAEVAEAKSQVRQAELARQFLRKSIESEVHEAFVNLETDDSVLETAELQMEYARENFDSVEGLFTEGLLASLSLIDAEQALNLAEREMVNAVYDQRIAVLRLERAVGLFGKGS